MRQRPLGRTSLMVSEIGLGAWGLGGPVYWERRASGYGASDDAACAVEHIKSRPSVAESILAPPLIEPPPPWPSP